MSKRSITIYNHLNNTEEVFYPEMFETTIFGRIFNSSIYRTLIENYCSPVCKRKDDYFCFSNLKKNHFRMSFDINISDECGNFTTQGFKGYTINVFADFDPAITVTVDYIDGMLTTATPPEALNAELNEIIVSLILVYLYDIDRLEKITPQDITLFCAINNKKRLLTQKDIDNNKDINLGFFGSSFGVTMDPYHLLYDILRYRAGIYTLYGDICFKLEGYNILRDTFLISYGEVKKVSDNRGDYYPVADITFTKNNKDCKVIISATEDTDPHNFDYKAAYNLAISMAARLFIEKSWQPIIEQLALDPKEIIYQNKMTGLIEPYTLNNVEENQYIKIQGIEIDNSTDNILTFLSRYKECLLQTPQADIYFQTIVWNNKCFKFKVSVAYNSQYIPFAIYSIQQGDIKIKNIKGKYLSTIEKYFLDARASLALDSIGNILMSITIAWIKYINFPHKKDDFGWISDYVNQKEQK